MDECRSQLKQHLEENDILQATKSDHRAYHASISKLGKDIDRVSTPRIKRMSSLKRIYVHCLMSCRISP